MRDLVALCFITAVVFAGPLRAEENDPTEPTDADRSVISTCIAKAGEDGADTLRCIGAVSKPCLAEPDNENTVMMAACLQREATIWDERLNDDYQALMAGLDGDPKDKLKAGQKAWLTVRNTTCDVEGSFWEGGTGLGGATAGCMLRETATRDLSLAALRAYLDQ
ncbi:lysozyme inhibitor LprI family protein [Pleomorphomonas oryzae]|uniref:lysozyme inhibitor LprI family protein n=1 Tax=Pleomorphomonas oryzae TaxID=261934 RepID=UPI000688E795|nr:lysozyme inhibitor LprI family protein [Pleomorphomonas oryzae]